MQKERNSALAQMGVHQHEFYAGSGSHKVWSET